MWVGKVTVGPLSATTAEDALDQGTELTAAQRTHSRACLYTEALPVWNRLNVKPSECNTDETAEGASYVVQLQLLPVTCGRLASGFCGGQSETSVNSAAPLTLFCIISGSKN